MSHIYNQFEFDLEKGLEEESRLQHEKRVRREARIKLGNRYIESKRSLIMSEES
jgi:hypothetical protein